MILRFFSRGNMIKKTLFFLNLVVPQLPMAEKNVAKISNKVCIAD